MMSETLIDQTITRLFDVTRHQRTYESGEKQIDVWRSLGNLGIYEPIEDRELFSTLCPVLLSLSKSNASVAISVLSHQLGIRLAKVNDWTGGPATIFNVPIFADILRISETLGRTGGLIFPNGVIGASPLIPVWSDGLYRIYSYDANALIQKQSIGGHKQCVLVAPIVLEDLTKQQLVSTHSRQDFEAIIAAFRHVASAIAIGLMQGAFVTARQFCEQRFQGGRRIDQWSQVRLDLAELDIEHRILSSLVSNAPRDLVGFGTNRLQEAISIKCLGAVVPFVDRALKMLGGFGYMKDFPQERRLRDAYHVQALFGGLNLRKLNYIEDKLW